MLTGSQNWLLTVSSTKVGIARIPEGLTFIEQIALLDSGNNKAAVNFNVPSTKRKKKVLMLVKK